jgi:glycosyltransferase involved in cell wall biosynthesis
MISAVVIAKNEEKLIETCLKSLAWVDEIIVADNGSTDKTLEIAKKYTNKIVQYDGQDFAELRNKAHEKATGDWVFYVDADERVLSTLKNEILTLVVDTKKVAYAVSRKNIIFGKAVSYGPYKKDWMIRLFKKDKFKTWVGKVHEHGTYDGELGYLKNSLIHLTHRNVEHIVLKSLEWSKIDANLRLQSNHPKMTGLRFIKILFEEIWNQGVKRKGFFGGTVGVMDSMLQVFSLFITYVRLWQLQQAESLEETYKNIDKKLEQQGFKE